MNRKAKPHKRSLVVGDLNGIRVLGLCHFVYEEFKYNDLTLVALYYGKMKDSKIKLHTYLKFAINPDVCNRRMVRLEFWSSSSEVATCLVLLVCLARLRNKIFTLRFL